MTNQDEEDYLLIVSARLSFTCFIIGAALVPLFQGHLETALLIAMVALAALIIGLTAVRP